MKRAIADVLDSIAEACLTLGVSLVVFTVASLLQTYVIGGDWVVDWVVVLTIPIMATIIHLTKLVGRFFRKRKTGSGPETFRY